MKTGPLICPVCESPIASRMSKAVQPWRMFGFSISWPVGQMYGCLGCGVTYVDYGDRVEALVKRTPKAPRNAEPDRILERASMSRNHDPDIFKDE